MPRVEFTPEWAEDIRTCYRRGFNLWGRRLADAYDGLIRTAIRDLVDSPTRAGSRARPDLGSDVRVWPVASSRPRADVGSAIRKPAHFVVYTWIEADERLVFLRLLQGGGLVQQHLPPVP